MTKKQWRAWKHGGPGGHLFLPPMCAERYRYSFYRLNEAYGNMSERTITVVAGPGSISLIMAWSVS